MATNIIGSWFPSGFHGFSKRTRSRNDMNIIYRELAKPLPPDTFMQRVKDPSKHAFSHHDNQKKYKLDTKFFDMGLDKKQPNKAHCCDFDKLLSTSGKNHQNSSYPYISTYRNTYRLASKEYPFHNVLNVNPCLCDQRSTTYQFAHGDANPFKSFILKKNKKLLGPNNTIESQRHASSAHSLSRDSVALCLQWNKHQSTKSDDASTSTTSLIVSTQI